MFILIGIVFFSLAILSVGVILFVKTIGSEILSFLKESDSVVDDHEE